MEKVNLKASKRIVVGRKVKVLRKTGQIPANIYGKKVHSIAISVDGKEFLAIFSKAGETGLVELTVDASKHPVLIHQVQYHPVTQYPIHIDFLQVDLKEKVTTKVPVVFVGEAIAVKEKIGVLLTLLTQVDIEALPIDLPDKLEVNVSSLKEIGQVLTVAAIGVTDKIKIITPVDHEIVKVAPLVSKEAEKMAAETAAAAAAAAASAAAIAPEAGSGAPSEKAPAPAAAKSEQK
jgi:large subunit ribosomal protein L25